jgi:U6 snRNA-associated Sm-like protein LSm4
MFPLKFLKSSKFSDVLVELKTGDSAKGILHSIDNFMNVKLKSVFYAEQIGPKFYNVDECFIRGSNIKSIQFRDDIIEKIKQVEEVEKAVANSKSLIVHDKKDKFKSKDKKNFTKDNNYNKEGGKENKDFIRRKKYNDEKKHENKIPNKINFSKN